MSDENMKNSLTDWKKLDATADEEIDTSDIPALDEDFFANAEVKMPKKKITVTMRIDPDVLDWFKSFGKGYQTRMNAVLRSYMDAKRTPSR